MFHTLICISSCRIPIARHLTLKGWIIGTRHAGLNHGIVDGGACLGQCLVVDVQSMTRLGREKLDRLTEEKKPHPFDKAELGSERRSSMEGKALDEVD